MRKSISIVLALALICLSIMPINAYAGCGFGRGGLFGRVFHPFRHQSAGYTYHQSMSYSYSVPVQSYSASSCAGGSCSVQSQGYYIVPQATPQTPALPSKSLPAAPQGTPQGSLPAEVQDFLARLNYMRSQRGLPMVSYDVVMYTDASQNNRFQLLQGIGHFFMGRARRQNAAVGQSNSYQVLMDWCGSPGHADALFDPSIRLAAVAHDGAAWTFSAR